MDFSTLADEIAALAHRCWCKRMLEDGWRAGKLLDRDTLTHDALRPYRDLAPEDRARLRQRVAWDELEQALGGSVGDALDKRELSALDLYVGMRVRLADGDPDDIGTVISWAPNPSEPEVLDEIVVAWPNGDVVEYCPGEEEIVPVDDPAAG